MTRTSPPDPTAPLAVVTAATLAGALAAARTAYGPAATVVRALRVRRGVRGMLGRERYEVHVQLPASDPAPGTQPGRGRPSAAAGEHGSHQSAPGPDEVLRGLVDAADETEDSAPAWSWTGTSEVSALLDVVTARQGREPGGHPDPALGIHSLDLVRPRQGGRPGAPVALDDERGPAGPSTDPFGQPGRWRRRLLDTVEELADAPAPPRPAGPRPVAAWDRGSLRAAGVPAAVLRRLPAEDPSDDAGWRRALREAIAAVVPPPAEPSEGTPVVVSGHGLAGVVAVLRAAAEEGRAPGTIALGDRRRPATPAALVEVLAACVRS